MEIIRNKQLIEDVFNYDVVLFGMGINNSMNNGLSYDISLNFPEVRNSENLTGYGDKRKYGNIHETKLDNKVIFCACYCYNAGLKKSKDDEFIDYDALKECLTHISTRYKGKRIGCPIIGQDKYDGNGDKNKILEIFKEIFTNGFDITLYDFVQQDYKKERYKEAVRLRKEYTDGLLTKDEFKHKKKINEWKRISGIFKTMPPEFEYKPKRKSENKIKVF